MLLCQTWKLDGVTESQQADGADIAGLSGSAGYSGDLLHVNPGLASHHPRLSGWFQQVSKLPRHKTQLRTRDSRLIIEEKMSEQLEEGEKMGV